MLKHRRIIQSSARQIAAAANRTVLDYTAGRVEHEPDFTGKMLGRMEEAMNGYTIRHVRWTAKILTSHGPNAQEKKFGADFMGVVEFDLPDYRVKKGFLAQAKRIETGDNMEAAEWDRMVHQCKHMLDVTTESFVFIYARSSITVIPALAIVSAKHSGNPHDFYSRTAQRFYTDHFECFVGDPEISEADVATLERVKMKRALYLAAQLDEPLLDAVERAQITFD